jgi:hypothetical protein
MWRGTFQREESCMRGRIEGIEGRCLGVVTKFPRRWGWMTGGRWRHSPTVENCFTNEIYRASLMWTFSTAAKDNDGKKERTERKRRKEEKRMG